MALRTQIVLAKTFFICLDNFISEGYIQNMQTTHRDKNLRLIEAAFAGNIAEARRLIAEGADMNARDTDGWSAFLYAVDSQDIGLVELMLENGAEIRSRAPGGTPLISQAIIGPGIFDEPEKWRNELSNEDARLEIVQKLIFQGAGLNDRDFSGATPLHHSAMYGYSRIARLLLRHGADPNPLGMTGVLGQSFPVTPLWVALRREHYATADVIRLNGGCCLKPMR